MQVPGDSDKTSQTCSEKKLLQITENYKENDINKSGRVPDLLRKLGLRQ